MVDTFEPKSKRDKNVIFLFRLIVALQIILIITTSLLFYAYLTDLKRRECNIVNVEDSSFDGNSLQNDPTKIVMRKLKMVNEDDHPIVFDMCEKDVCQGEKLIAPKGEYEIKFPSKFTTVIKCKAWFNGVENEPWNFVVWKGTENTKDVKYMVRKNDGIYKAEYDGSNELVHIKFA
uniref:Uncharacterized protein n=1 Tax=Panagrolaimus sp. PS1159 TaxID=55785 RepID=A0AC35FK68_9BILA